MSEAVELVLHVPPLFPMSITEFPEQKVVLPIAEIVAAVGSGFNVIEIVFEVVLPHEFVVVT